MSSLSRIGTPAAIDVLIAALDTKDVDLRQSIAASLWDLTHMSFGMDLADWQQWRQSSREARPVQPPAKPPAAARTRPSRPASPPPTSAAPAR